MDSSVKQENMLAPFSNNIANIIPFFFFFNLNLTIQVYIVVKIDQ